MTVDVVAFLELLAGDAAEADFAGPSQAARAAGATADLQVDGADGTEAAEVLGEALGHPRTQIPDRRLVAGPRRCGPGRRPGARERRAGDGPTDCSALVGLRIPAHRIGLLTTGAEVTATTSMPASGTGPSAVPA